MMNLSKLNRRIAIQEPLKTDDGMGGYETEWRDIFSVWAAIWPVSAKQVIANEAVISVTSHRIRIRYRSDIKSEYRVRYKDRYFTIYGQPINVDEGNVWMDLMCKETV